MQVDPNSPSDAGGPSTPGDGGAAPGARDGWCLLHRALRAPKDDGLVSGEAELAAIDVAAYAVGQLGGGAPFGDAMFVRQGNAGTGERLRAARALLLGRRPPTLISRSICASWPRTYLSSSTSGKASEPERIRRRASKRGRRADSRRPGVLTTLRPSARSTRSGSVNS